MSEYTEKMRAVASRLLGDCTVEMVIGFRKGDHAHDERAVLYHSRRGCVIPGLGQQLRDQPGELPDQQEREDRYFRPRAAIHATSSTISLKTRSSAISLHIVGVPCTGMIDKRKINAMVDGEILEVTETETTIKVRTADAETLLDKGEVLQQNCALCIHRNPVISDEMLGDPVEEQTDVDRYADVRKIEEMGDEEKWQFFEDLLAPCIRCYACRNACPLCYCPTCFVDESKPQWVGKGQDPIDIRTFHFLRAYHCAGRCYGLWGLPTGLSGGYRHASV